MLQPPSKPDWEYAKPVDRNDRRRRVYRFKKMHPGARVRGVSLHEDGRRLKMDEIIAVTLKHSWHAFAANMVKNNALLRRIMGR